MSLRQIDLCDIPDCTSVKAAVCPLCERDCCTAHLNGEVEIVSIVRSKYVPSSYIIPPLIDSIMFCNYCVAQIQRARKNIAEMTDPDIIKRLRAGITKTALEKE